MHSVQATQYLNNDGHPYSVKACLYEDKLVFLFAVAYICNSQDFRLSLHGDGDCFEDEVGLEARQGFHDRPLLKSVSYSVISISTTMSNFVFFLRFNCQMMP